MLLFGGLRKHEKAKHVLVGLGSAALAAAPYQVRQPKFPETVKGIIRCIFVNNKLN